VEQLNIGFHQVWNNIEKSDTTAFLNKQEHKFQAIQVTPYTIIMELGKLDTTKAPGPDNINNRILKTQNSNYATLLHTSLTSAYKQASYHHNGS
jgi:hypothetical protein